jgi:hypothetical protein
MSIVCPIFGHDRQMLKSKPSYSNSNDIRDLLKSLLLQSGLLLYYCYTWKDTFFALVTILEGASSRVGLTTVLTSDHPREWRFLKYRFYCLRMVYFLCPTMYLTHARCKGRWFPVLWYCPNVNVQVHLCKFWCVLFLKSSADYDDIVLFGLHMKLSFERTVVECPSSSGWGGTRHQYQTKISSSQMII